MMISSNYFLILNETMLINQMSNIKKVCAAGLGAVCAAMIVQLLNKQQQWSKRRSQEEEARQQEDKNKQQLKYLKKLQQILIKKKKYFEIQYSPENHEFLTKECLINFIRNSSQIINPKQFESIYLENRKARRSVYSDIDQKYQTYFRFVTTLDENIKYLIEKTEKDFAAFIDLDFNIIVGSLEYHIEADEYHNSSEFRDFLIELTMEIREDLSHNLPLYAQSIPKQKMIEILDYQLELFTNKQEFILDLVNKMGLENREEQEAIPHFLNFYIADSVYDRFGIEVQQMTLETQQITEEIRQKFEKITELKDKLIKKMHKIIEQSLIMFSEQLNQQL